MAIMFAMPPYIYTQSKYYENEISWTWGQSCSDIIYISDTSFVLGCGSYYNSVSREKSNLIFSDDSVVDYTVLSYGAEYGDFVRRDMLQTPTGFALCGRMNNGIADSYNQTYDHQYLMETDFEGNLLNFYDLKQFPYQGDAMCMHYYPETNTYYVGGEAFISTMPTQMWLLKMTNGEVVWRYNYGSYDYRNAIHKLLPTSNGGVYAIADVNVYTGFHFGNFAILKINSDGFIEWSEIFSVGFEDRLTDAILTYDEGFLLCGGSNLPNPINNNRLYATLLRLDSTRSIIWSKQYLTESYRSEMVKCYEQGEDFICIGNVKYVGIHWKAFIMKIRGSDGEPLWTRLYDYGAWHDYFYNFTPVPQPLGGFVCVGRAEPVGGADVYIVKTNCMGLLTLPQAAYTVAQDPAFPSRFLFTNQSQYAYPDSIDGGHYIVNWGDGSAPFLCGQGFAPCTQDNLLHTYQAPGIYPVTLQAIVCNDTSTLTRAVCLGVEPNPQAQFTYTDFGGAIQFTNLSQNAYLTQGGYCVWHFGDGSPTTTQINPTHTFTENGNYPVTLTVVVCQDTSVYMQFVQVQTVGVSPPFFEGGQGGQQVVVYPNPAQNTLHFTLQNSLTPPVGWSVSLFTPAGQQVLHSSASLVGTQAMATHTVQVGHLPVGIYFYTVQSGGVVLARGKVAVVR